LFGGELFLSTLWFVNALKGANLPQRVSTNICKTFIVSLRLTRNVRAIDPVHVAPGQQSETITQYFVMTILLVSYI
jgi:hypothetical protein